MNLIFRKATEQDIELLTTLNGMLADYHYAIDLVWNNGEVLKESFETYVKIQLQREQARWLIAEVDGKVAGYFSAEISPTKPAISYEKVGHVSSCYVLEEYRGKGIAKAAMQYFLDWFRAHNIKLVEVGVDARNVQGVKAWEALGFQEYMKKMKMEI